MTYLLVAFACCALVGFLINGIIGALYGLAIPVAFLLGCYAVVYGAVSLLMRK